MQLTPEEKQTGKDNFNESVGSVRKNDPKFIDSVEVSRRAFLTGSAAVLPGLGAVYFGYQELKGDPVRVGFIGTGDEGNVLITQHSPEYMNIVAVADIRPSNLKRAFEGDGNEHRVGLNKKLGLQTASKIKRYSDHRELLKDPNVEAVVIAVPLVHHGPIAIEAMKAGKHVLTEKLMAHTVTECKEMIKVSRETKKFLAVGHQRHYSVLYANANELIRQGLLGDIKYIRAQWHRNNSFPGRDSWRSPISREDATALEGKVDQFGYRSMNELINWRLYNRTGAGLMAELGSHQMDACSIFLGKKHPLAVQGFGGKNYYGVKGVGSMDKQGDDREIDDHVYVILEFPGPHHQEDPNDIVIVTYSSINTNRLEPYGETVFGSRATLMVQQEQEALLYKEASAETGPGGVEQRLNVIAGSGSGGGAEGGGGPVLSASPSLAPSTRAALAGGMMEVVSRGYTEEMQHFCYCIRENLFEVPPDKGGLRCNGVVAMADAIMAFTANLAMKHRKRIVFKDDWFAPDNPAAPETDPEIIG